MDFDINIINWLCESKNPAIEYRTRIDLLDEKVNNSKVIDWINNILPNNWKNTKGLWLIYYYTAIAECGINGHEFDIKENDIIEYYRNYPFQFTCSDFMLLRAFVMLGFGRELQNIGIMEKLKHRQLMDGGFLCLLENYKDKPKSCVKCNNIVLLLLSECKKRNIGTSIQNRFLEYFWNHNIFYKSTDLSSLILDQKIGWRTIDTFYPFEPMRVGLQNMVESFCGLVYVNDKRLNEEWNILESKKDSEGKYILDGTLTKSYLPKEKIGKSSKWVTFYVLLAKKAKKIMKSKKNYST
jgi:hypothetical protein